MDVRVCIPRMAGFYEMEPLNKGNSITGAVASFILVSMEIVSELNATFQVRESMVSLVDVRDSRFDGCIGLMQRNESDISLGVFNIPLTAKNITYTKVEAFDKMGILSGYDRRKEGDKKATHVMDMIFAFSPTLWILVIMTFALLFVLLFMSMRIKIWNQSIRRARRRRLGISRPCARKQMVQRTGILSTVTRAVVSSLLKQSSATPPSISGYGPLNLLFTMMTLLSFYSGYYLTSMIKTEMVVVEKPITVESYEDVLRMGKWPVWLASFTDMVTFQNAADGSLEQEIWNKAIALGINESLIQMTPDSFINHGMRLAKKETVAFMSQFLGERAFPYCTCVVSRASNISTNTNFLFRQDESAKETLRFSIENHVIERQVSRRVSYRIQKIFEAGLKNAALRYIDPAPAFGLTNVDQHFRAIRECCSNVVMMPEAELHPVPPHHYLSLALTAAALLCSAVVVLAIELLSESR